MIVSLKTFLTHICLTFHGILCCITPAVETASLNNQESLMCITHTTVIELMGVELAVRIACTCGNKYTRFPFNKSVTKKQLDVQTWREG